LVAVRCRWRLHGSTVFIHLWTAGGKGWIGRLASNVIINFSENGAGKPLHALHRLVTLYCILLISQNMPLRRGRIQASWRYCFSFPPSLPQAQQARLVKASSIFRHWPDLPLRSVCLVCLLFFPRKLITSLSCIAWRIILCIMR